MARKMKIIGVTSRPRTPIVQLVPKPVDMVNHPAHYTAGSIECLDAIEAALGARGFADYLRGQVIKYNWRLALKGNAPEDTAKAEFYAKRLVLHLQRHPNLYTA
jgi:hypothetical protein